MSQLTHQGFPAIVNLDGKPFPDYQSADFFRDQLTVIAPEYGFTVQDLPTGGFIVVQSVKVERTTTATPSQPQSGTQQTTPKPTNMSPELRQFAASLPLVIHPAWRNYLFRWAFVLLFIFLAYTADFLIANFIPQDWLVIAYDKVPRLNRFVAGTLWLLVIYHIFYILKEVYTNTYTVTSDGLKSKKGIIARDAHSIKFRDIRGVNLQQDVIDRLLGVGTIEFHTAGTDEAEVIFARIAHPAYLRDRIDAYVAWFKHSRD